MRPIKKQYVLDDDKKRVAVIIGYEDWLEIEQLLALDYEEKGPFDINQFAGKFDIGEDPVEWQRRTRGEWERDER